MLSMVNPSGVAFLSRESDATLRSAERILAECPYACLRRLSCTWHDGSVAVTGNVPSYFLKQMAHTLVRRVAGGCLIEDHIQVIEEQRAVKESR